MIKNILLTSLMITNSITNVYTPNGTSVSVYQFSEFNSSQINELNLVSDNYFL